MDYMEKSAHVRADIRNFLPSARSVIVMGTVYNTDQGSGIRDRDGIREPGAGSRSRSRDTRAGRIITRSSRTGCSSSIAWMEDRSPSPFEAAHFVDKHQVQERVFAHHAGIGWIGKNSCVINPELGSWMFLSGIATSLDARAGRACARSMRRVHALHRRLSDRRARRRARARRDQVHFLSHDRDRRGDPRSAARADRQSRLGLRHLPGRLPVEPRARRSRTIRCGRARTRRPVGVGAVAGIRR